MRLHPYLSKALVGLALTLGLAVTVLAITVGCRCTITFVVGNDVPAFGQHRLHGTDGNVFVEDDLVTTLDSLTVETDNRPDPNNPARILAAVQSVSGSVAPFRLNRTNFERSFWTLDAATPTCGNMLVFDRSQSDGDNVHGCFVLRSEGGINQKGVEVRVDGTNFDPTGERPIEAIGSTTNFDLAALGL